MKRFEYLVAKDFPSASSALEALPTAVAKGGGTDLLDLLKERVLEPEEVISLTRAKRPAPEPGKLSALTTLRELGEDSWLAEQFPAVQRAASEAATPQIRNVGTLGGNLCQTTRCPYLRNKGFACFRLGTGACAAVQPGAHNRTHAIFAAPGCACAHPSNLAPALIAVKAKLVLVRGDKRREIDAEDLYQAPRPGTVGDVALKPGELVEAAVLTPSALAKRSTYLELRERQSFDFALASVAAAVDLSGGKVKEARIVCGGLAPTPHRAKPAEAMLRGKPLDDETIAAAAAAAVRRARPLEQNAFKVTIAERLIARALKELKA